MKLIIDMPEDVFKRTVFYREFRDLNDYVTTIKALEKAVPLPKGHGRLIDADALINKCAYDLDNNFVIDLIDVKEAPTIIETDKGE